MRILRRIALVFLLSLLGIVFLLFLILNLPFTRNFVTTRVNGIFETVELPIHLSGIKRVYPWSVKVDAVAIPSLEGDTMIYARGIKAGIRPMQLLRSKVKITEVKISHARVALLLNEQSREYQIAEAFTANRPPPEAKKKESNWRVYIRSARLEDVDYGMNDPVSGIRLEQTASSVKLKDFKVLVPERSIEARVIDLRSGSGELALIPRVDKKKKKKKPGPPWNFVLYDLDLEDLNFSFLQPADSLSLHAAIGRLSARTREMDIPGRVLALPSFELKETDLDVKTAGNPGGMKVSGLKLDLNRVLLGGGQAEGRIASMKFDLGQGMILKKLKGSFSSDPEHTRVDCRLETGESRVDLTADAHGWVLDLISDPEAIRDASIAARDCRISPREVARFFPDMADWPYYAYFSGSPLELDASAKLRNSKLLLEELSLSQERQYHIHAEGSLLKPFPIAGASADMELWADHLDPVWLGSMLDSILPLDSLPDLSGISLNARIRDSLLSPGFKLALNTNLGNVTVDGTLDIQKEEYAAISSFDRVQLAAFFPVEGLSPLTGQASAWGSGFHEESFRAEISLWLDSLHYLQYPLSEAEIDASIKTGDYRGHVVLSDPALRGTLHASVVTVDTLWQAEASGDIFAQLDRLGLSEDTIAIETALEAGLEKNGSALSSELLVRNIGFLTPDTTARIGRMEASLQTDTAHTLLSAEADFFHVVMDMSLAINEFSTLNESVRAYTLTFLDSLQYQADTRIHKLPDMHVMGNMKDHQVLDFIVGDTGISFSNLDLTFHNRLSENNLQAYLRADSLVYGKISAGAMEAMITDSSGRVEMRMQVDRTAHGDGSAYNWELSGKVEKQVFLTNLHIRDQEQQVYYSLEAGGTYGNRQLVMEVPSRQLILHRHPWYMDSPSLLRVDLASNRVYPDLHMHRDTTTVSLYTPPGDTSIHYRLDLGHVFLGSLLSGELLQGAPEGDISGSIDYWRREDKTYEISTGLALSDARFSSLDFELITLDGSLSALEKGSYDFDLHARFDSASLDASGSRTEQVPLQFQSEFRDLPIRIVQPLVKDHVSEMSGRISGRMLINPALGKTEYDGALHFRDARLRVLALNTPFSIPDQQILLSNGLLELDKFRILDTLGKPLTVDGTILFQSENRSRADLEISSSNLQVMSRDPNTEAAFSGNVFVDSWFTVQGPLTQPAIDGRILLDQGTEIFYRHLEDLSISESERVVSFVSHDQEGSQQETSISQTQNSLIRSSIETLVEIDPSTALHFDLSRRIYNMGLDITGGGTLKYNLLDNQQVDLSGRYEIGEGEALLQLTGWPNKAFTISEGGYIRWDGRVENPELSFEAVNQVNSSYVNPVDGQRRDAEFLVVLQLSDYLSDLDVVFTVSTPDQYIMSIINTMSPEEQMHQAISILLFETIDMPGISSSNDYMTQQVNQIVSAQLNQLTASTIKGVDISFGLDSYNQNVQGGGEETTTNLTYEVGKTFMNDRARVEVSGRIYEVNQQPGATDVSHHNISFEYQLDSAASKYLRAYNEQSYEDVFEGEVIKTGVGFTYRKRYTRLGDIFRRKERRKGP